MGWQQSSEINLAVLKRDDFRKIIGPDLFQEMPTKYIHRFGKPYLILIF